MFKCTKLSQSNTMETANNQADGVRMAEVWGDLNFPGQLCAALICRKWWREVLGKWGASGNLLDFPDTSVTPSLQLIRENSISRCLISKLSSCPCG